MALFTSLKPDELTWDLAFRLFSLRNKSQNLSERTQVLYDQHLGAFRKWLAANGSPKLPDVNATTIRSYLEARKAAGNKAITIDCSFRIIRTFWNFLQRDGLVLTNPMAKVERPRREKRFAKPFTTEQFKLLLESIDTRDVLGLRDYALIVFLADTGLRISEALAIKLPEIDWSSNSIVVFGKGAKSRRVAFGQTAARMLRAWIQRRGIIEGSDWLWVNRLGQQMRRANAEQQLKKHTIRAGIAQDRLNCHALRHAFSLNFLRNGGSVMALQRLLGHSSLEQCRAYLNMTDDDVLTAHRQSSPCDRLGPLPGEIKRFRLK